MTRLPHVMTDRQRLRTFLGLDVPGNGHTFARTVVTFFKFPHINTLVERRMGKIWTECKIIRMAASAAIMAIKIMAWFCSLSGNMTNAMDSGGTSWCK